jgi:hypothetical protein
MSYKESDDETLVKEKATVRKKRVSKAETKGEESDSSDLDQKEAANKATPPKSSRLFTLAVIYHMKNLKKLCVR